MVGSKRERDGYWRDCVARRRPFLVYQSKFVMGVFAYDLSVAGMQLNDAGYRMLLDLFDSMYTKNSLLQDHSFVCERTRGYASVLVEEARNIATSLIGIVSDRKFVEKSTVLLDDLIEVEVWWPRLGGL